MEERAIKWMENNGVTCYTIFDVGKEKRAERMCNSVNEATGEFVKDYEILSDGKYFIKGMTNPKGDRGAVRMDFVIGIIGSNNNNVNSYGGMTAEQIRAEAYEQARKDMQWEILDKRVTEIEKKQKAIIAILIDLTDGDESNDDKATKVLEVISNAKENFEGAKDLLKDIKL